MCHAAAFARLTVFAPVVVGFEAPRFSQAPRESPRGTQTQAAQAQTNMFTAAMATAMPMKQRRSAEKQARALPRAYRTRHVVQGVRLPWCTWWFAPLCLRV